MFTLVQAVIVAVSCRLVALALLLFGRDANGELFAVGPWPFLLMGTLQIVALAVSFLAVMLAVKIAMDCTNVYRVSGAITKIVAGTLLTLSALLVFVDFSTQRHTGDRLALTVVRHYLSFNTVDGEFIDTLLSDTLGTVSLAAVTAIAMLGPVVCLARQSPRSDTSVVRVTLAAVVLISGLWLFHAANPKNFRFGTVMPVEALMLRDAVFGVGVDPPMSEEETLYALRTLWRTRGGGAGQNFSWTYPIESVPKYPLLRTHDNSAAVPRPATQPDIIIVVMESLRGRDTWFVGHQNSSSTPNMDRLATDEALSFTRFISTAPSSRNAFFAIQCSLWPHLTLIPVTDLTLTKFDCLSLRLQDWANYNTFVGVGYNPSMENLLPWMKRLYKTRVYPETAGAEVNGERHDMSDGALYDRALSHYDASITSNASQPQLLYLCTASTHAPFFTHDPVWDAVSPTQSSTHDRYLHALRYADQEFGRLVDEVKKRDRETVLMLVGDHAYPMSGGDEYVSMPGVRGLPCDHRSFTAGLMWTHRATPRTLELVGEPGTVINSAVSSVDIFPSILELVGDVRPTVSFGRSFFSNLKDRLVVSIAEGGQRITALFANCYKVPSFSAVWGVWDDDGRFPDFCAPNFHNHTIGHIFSADEPPESCVREMAQVNRAAKYLSWLMQENRIWHPDLLKSIESKKEDPESLVLRAFHLQIFFLVVFVTQHLYCGYFKTTAFDSPQLSEAERVALVAHRYSSRDLSPVSAYILQPFWNWAIRFVPIWIAPNVITAIGTGVMLLITCATSFVSTPLSPPWCFAAAACLFFYQTMDNLDGRQARRTLTSSPMGQLFDHGCDSVVIVLVAILTANVAGATVYECFVLWLVQAAGLWMCSWSEYHEGVFTLDVINGPTEGILILVGIYVAGGIFGTEKWHSPIIHGISPIQLFLFLSVVGCVVSAMRLLSPRASQLIPMVTHLLVASIWVLLDTPLWSEWPRTMTFFVGLSFAQLASQFTLAHLAGNRPVPLISRSQLPLFVCAAVSIFAFDKAVSPLSAACFVAATTWQFASWWRATAKSVCSALGIRMWRI